jgi:hypothetical protein
VNVKNINSQNRNRKWRKPASKGRSRGAAIGANDAIDVVDVDNALPIDVVVDVVVDVAAAVVVTIVAIESRSIGDTVCSWQMLKNAYLNQAVMMTVTATLNRKRVFSETD